MNTATAVKEYQDLITQIFQNHGMGGVKACIYSHIQTSPETISLDELANLTGYSLATVSNTVRFFEKLHIVKRVKKPGTKRVYAEAKRNFMEVFEDQMESIFTNEIKPTEEHMPVIIRNMKEEMKTAKGEEKKLYKQQLSIMERHLEETRKAAEILSAVTKKVKNERRRMEQQR